MSSTSQVTSSNPQVTRSNQQVNCSRVTSLNPPITEFKSTSCKIKSMRWEEKARVEAIKSPVKRKKKQVQSI